MSHWATQVKSSQILSTSRTRNGDIWGHLSFISLEKLWKQRDARDSYNVTTLHYLNIHLLLTLPTLPLLPRDVVLAEVQWRRQARPRNNWRWKSHGFTLFIAWERFFMLTNDSFDDFISMFFSSKLPTSPGRRNAAFKLLHRVAAFIQPKPSKKLQSKCQFSIMPTWSTWINMINMCVS